MIDEVYILTSEKIRDYRKDSGLKSNEVARLLNISPMYYCEIEKGRKIPKNRKFIDKLCTILHIDINTLIFLIINDYTCYMRDKMSKKLGGVYER